MEYATVKELSELLKVSIFTIYSWVRNKQIPHIKINGLIRFDMKKIMEWLEECQRKPEEAVSPIRYVKKDLDIDRIIKNAVEEVSPKEYNRNIRETGPR